MIVSPYTIRLLHDEKVREIMKHAPHNQRINELGAVSPNAYDEGLLPSFRQWLSSRRNRNHPTEVATEVRCATAQ